MPSMKAPPVALGLVFLTFRYRTLHRGDFACTSPCSASCHDRLYTDNGDCFYLDTIYLDAATFNHAVASLRSRFFTLPRLCLLLRRPLFQAALCSKQHCVPSSIVLLSEYNARWILGKSRTLRNRAGRTLECTAIGRWLRFDRHTGRNRTANCYRRPRRRGPGISGCKRMWISVIFLPSQAGKDLYVLVAVA